MILDARLFGSAAQSARTALLRRELALCKGPLRRRRCFFQQGALFCCRHRAFGIAADASQNLSNFPTLSHLSHSQRQLTSRIVFY